MICPQCRTQNQNDYVFCVNCGLPIGPNAPSKEPATFIVPQAPVVGDRSDPPSQPTVLRPAPKSGSWKPAVLILTVCLVLVSAAGGYIAYLSFSNRAEPEKSVLPDHLGLFFIPTGGATPQAIKQLETGNLLESRDLVANDSSLLTTPSQPEFVLYADPNEIPVGDLRLIRLDTISDDGKAKYLEFQAAIIDNKPAMKRLRFAQPLSDGRYAFALLSGFANEGRHRLWPFEVKAGSPNGAPFTQELTLDLKPTPSPTPAATKEPEKSEPPVGSTVAFLTRTDVWLRRSPALQDKGKVTLLKPRQKVFVIRYSTNSDTWEGITSNWAFVQTENGRQGWVFNAFLDHGR